MRAENCTRYTFELGGQVHKYADLRHYVCARCGGQIVHLMPWNEAQQRSEDRVGCGRCGGQEILSESSYLQRRSQSLEARYSLPLGVRRFYDRKGNGMPLKDIDVGDLTRLGNIRLGWTEPGQSGRDKIVASDYFVMTDAQFLVPFLGEKPTELQIHFPYPAFDSNIAADYRVWVGGRRRGSGIDVCRGDGEVVHSALPFKVSVDKDGGTHVNRAPGDRLVSYGRAAVDFTWDDHSFREGDIVPCPGKSKGLYPHCAVCEPGILLKVMIREPIAAARWGYWQIATKSLRNYRHFKAVWASITNGGQIYIPMNDVPFVLRIVPGTTLFQNQSDGMWGATEKFYLKLEVTQDVAELVEGARKRRFVAMVEGRGDPTMLAPRLAATLEADFEGPLPFDEPPISDADCDGDLIEGDPFLEEEEAPEEPPAPVETKPVPKDLNHKNIVKLAVEQLSGYENVGQVKTAMYALYKDGWDKSTEWSPTEAWALLQQHAQSG